MQATGHPAPVEPSVYDPGAPGADSCARCQRPGSRGFCLERVPAARGARSSTAPPSSSTTADGRLRKAKSPPASNTSAMCGRYSLADAEREKLGERFLLALEALEAIDPRPR